MLLCNTPSPPPHVLMDIKVVQMVKARESPWHHGQCKGLDRFTLIQKYIIQLCRQHKSVFPHDIRPLVWGRGRFGKWLGREATSGNIIPPHVHVCALSGCWPEAIHSSHPTFRSPLSWALQLANKAHIHYIYIKIEVLSLWIKSATMWSVRSDSLAWQMLS